MQRNFQEAKIPIKDVIITQYFPFYLVFALPATLWCFSSLFSGTTSSDLSTRSPFSVSLSESKTKTLPMKRKNKGYGVVEFNKRSTLTQLRSTEVIVWWWWRKELSTLTHPHNFLRATPSTWKWGKMSSRIDFPIPHRHKHFSEGASLVGGRVFASLMRSSTSFVPFLVHAEARVKWRRLRAFAHKTAFRC